MYNLNIRGTEYCLTVVKFLGALWLTVGVKLWVQCTACNLHSVVEMNIYVPGVYEEEWTVINELGVFD